MSHAAIGNLLNNFHLKIYHLFRIHWMRAKNRRFPLNLNIKISRAITYTFVSWLSSSLSENSVA